MGSTVTTNRLVHAFRHPNGQISYAGWEATYEKNVYPHTPRWSRVVGSLEDIVRRIFLWASACEGGLLQDPRGWIAPEVYIRRWMARLANPIPAASQEDLLDKPPYGGRGRRPRWTQQPDGNHDLGRHTPTGPTTRPPRRWPEYRLVTVGRDEPEVFEMDHNGSLHHVGWRYRVVSGFVSTYTDLELRYPGSYFEEIQAFRRHVHEAPTCDPDMVLEIRETKPGDSTATRLIQVLGRAPTLGQLMARQNAAVLLYDATYCKAVLHPPQLLARA